MRMRPDANSSSRGRPARRGQPPLGSVDHIAIVVDNTDDALAFYRDKLGLRVIDSELLDDQQVRLTQLDLGTCDLQLVEPLAGHPDRVSMLEGGERLHHLCFSVNDIRSATAALRRRGVFSRDKTPRSGPRGRIAAFMEPATTRGVLIELTAEGAGPGTDPDAG